jgi:transposase
LYLLKTNRFLSVHFTTIHRTLERTRVSRKKLQRIAKERDEDQRAEFIANMARYLPEELGFIDEVSRDERVVGRLYGRSRKGQRARKCQPFTRGRRTSTVGVLTIDGFLCGMSVEGSLTKDVLLKWLEFSVVRNHSILSIGYMLTLFQLPKCSAYPGPCSVLVLDNATIHHGDEILVLADRFGVRIEYLPPYSPDLNPIEEAFSKIKHFIRRNQDYYYMKDGDDGLGILYDMYEVLDIVTSDDAKGYIAHAGYF